MQLGPCYTESHLVFSGVWVVAVIHSNLSMCTSCRFCRFSSGPDSAASQDPFLHLCWKIMTMVKVRWPFCTTGSVNNGCKLSDACMLLSKCDWEWHSQFYDVISVWTTWWTPKFSVSLMQFQFQQPEFARLRTSILSDAGFSEPWRILVPLALD